MSQICKPSSLARIAMLVPAVFVALFASAALFAPDTSHASRFVHSRVDFCMTPRELPDTVPADGGVGQALLVLHHNRGECNDVDATDLDFIYDSKRKRLVHQATGRCARWEGSKDAPVEHARILLDSNCDDERGRFFLKAPSTQEGPHQWVLKNAYWQCLGLPREYENNPGRIRDQLKIVIRDGCRTHFKVHGAGVKTEKAPKRGVLVHRTSSKCVAPEEFKDENNVTMVLRSNCDYTSNLIELTLLESGEILHTLTNKCLHPHGGRTNPHNNTRLVLHDGCSRSNLKFKLLASGSLQHRSSGKCVHPSGGSPTPRDGTGLVLHDGCNESRLAFEFVPSGFKQD